MLGQMMLVEMLHRFKQPIYGPYGAVESYQIHDGGIIGTASFFGERVRILSHKNNVLFDGSLASYHAMRERGYINEAPRELWA